MSRAQDPHPNKSFFPFGNPFRMISPKGSRLSPQQLTILHEFEAKLAERLRKLTPKSKDEILSFSWMTSAMASIRETHSDVLTLIADLELPVIDWDDKWKDVYLDISVKLLDICNAFTSEISRLNQSNLSVKCALHSLESASPKHFIRACSSLDSWRQLTNSRNPRIEKCLTVLDDLVGSLDLPKVKNSAKGKALMQAMYGVKVQTVFVCSVFAAAFSASPKKLLNLDVADVYSWAPAFRSLQSFVNEEIRVRFSSGRFSVLNELEAIDASVKELYPIIQGSVDTVKMESYQHNVHKLSNASGNLSQGLDLLAKEVDGFFQVVLTSRDTLLSNLRPDKIVNERVHGSKVLFGLVKIAQVILDYSVVLLRSHSDSHREMSVDSAEHSIRGVATHGGRYVQYNIYGNLFEVSTKYVPPIRPVGRGAYGIVCAAVNAETREEVAIKKVGNAFDNRIDAKRTLREIKLLRHMDHENVMSIKDIIRPPQKENFNDVYIVSELMDTDLHQIIRSNQPLTDDHCRYFLYQLLRGLKYVHSANVLHRDLKPSNLLLNANCDLKIADFGLARTTSETDFMTEYVVTRWYRAPELLLNCSEYTAAIDIWSVGCILGEIMTRQPLFPGRDYVHQLRLITELVGSPDDASLGFLQSDNARRYVKQLPQCPKQNFSAKFPNISAGAIDLLEKMLIFDPSKRITVDEALCHPYMAPLHDINEEPVCLRPFSFDFEQPSFTEEDIKELIWRESLKFNPDPPIY
ncbi:hypothetical protein AHAS_Ahas02G0012900 [Arachis hypogaea]